MFGMVFRKIECMQGIRIVKYVSEITNLILQIYTGIKMAVGNA